MAKNTKKVEVSESVNKHKEEKKISKPVVEKVKEEKVVEVAVEEPKKVEAPEKPATPVIRTKKVVIETDCGLKTIEVIY